MSKWGGCLSVLVAISTTGVLLAQSPKTSAEITKDRRGALDGAFKHWEIATIEAAACAQGDGAAPKPAIEGDFNSDGLPDAAALIKTPQGVYFVAVIARLEHNEIVEVDAVGAEAAKVGLRVMPRGKAYKTEGDKFDNYLAADTLVISPCGQPSTAYLWNGYGFRKVVLGGATN